MHSLELKNLSSILCIGAHSDDIDIGAGATMLKLIRDNPAAHVTWVVLSAAGGRGDEARAGAGRFLAAAASHEIVLETFRDGYFPSVWADVKATVERLKSVRPDIVFTHHGRDLHQDHRIVSELTWNAFRDHLILEYEIPKYDGGLGSPNLFVPAAPADADAKLAILRDCFVTQAGKHWFDDLTFRGLMRLRGLECCAPDHLAEAFHVRKLRIA